MKVIHKKQIAKISELINDFYDEKQNLNIAGYVQTTNELYKIRTCSLDFLEENAGPLFNQITDNSNLNTEIINIFAQTFIKHFWNNQIGYSDVMSFYIKLSAFLEQELPIWGEFYKQLVLDKNAYINNLLNVTNTSGGLIHVESSTNTNSNGTSNTNSNGTNTTSGNSSSDGTQTSNGTNNTTTDNTSNTQTSNNTTDKGQSTDKAQAMQLYADTPQDAIEAGNFASDAQDPLTGYPFNYATNATGNKSKDEQNTQNTSDSSGSSSTTNQGTSKNTTSNTTTTHQEGQTTSEGTSQTTTQGNTTNNTTGNTSSDTTNSTNGTSGTKGRSLTIAEIARELSAFTNGAYLDVFKKAKKEGLFLLVY